jgi:hypothetical protein
MALPSHSMVHSSQKEETRGFVCCFICRSFHRLFMSRWRSSHNCLVDVCMADVALKLRGITAASLERVAVQKHLGHSMHPF